MRRIKIHYYQHLQSFCLRNDSFTKITLLNYICYHYNVLIKNILPKQFYDNNKNLFDDIRVLVFNLSLITVEK